MSRDPVELVITARGQAAAKRTLKRAHRRLLLLLWSARLVPIVTGVLVAGVFCGLDAYQHGWTWWLIPDALAGLAGYQVAWGYARFRRLERTVAHLLGQTRLQRHEEAVPHSVLVSQDPAVIRAWLEGRTR